MNKIWTLSMRIKFVVNEMARFVQVIVITAVACWMAWYILSFNHGLEKLWSIYTYGLTHIYSETVNMACSPFFFILGCVAFGAFALIPIAAFFGFLRHVVQLANDLAVDIYAP